MKPDVRSHQGALSPGAAVETRGSHLHPPSVPLRVFIFWSLHTAHLLHFLEVEPPRGQPKGS